MAGEKNLDTLTAAAQHDCQCRGKDGGHLGRDVPQDTSLSFVPWVGIRRKIRSCALFHRVEHSARYVLRQCSMGWNVSSDIGARSRSTVHSAHTLRLLCDCTSSKWPLSSILFSQQMLICGKVCHLCHHFATHKHIDIQTTSLVVALLQGKSKISLYIYRYPNP